MGIFRGRWSWTQLPVTAQMVPLGCLAGGSVSTQPVSAEQKFCRGRAGRPRWTGHRRRAWHRARAASWLQSPLVWSSVSPFLASSKQKAMCGGYQSRKNRDTECKQRTWTEHASAVGQEDFLIIVVILPPWCESSYWFA